MMNEPTLGQRIADAAAGWRMAEVDHGVSSDAAMDAWAELLTLCERADAAERLAIAMPRPIVCLGGSAALDALEDWEANIAVARAVSAAGGGR